MALSEIIALLRSKDKILYPITQLKNVTDDAEAKTAPADADSVPIADASDSGQMKKITWAAIKTALSNLFAAKSHTHNSATTSAAGLMSSADKTKLDGIAAGANKYTHPAYTARTSGLYKITVDATGHISAVTAVTKADITALGIPAQDTNTTYSAMKGASANTAGAAGLVPAPAAGKQTSFLRGDGTWAVPTNTTYANMKGATASAAGTAGLVPAPSAGAATRYLRSDGTWAVPPDMNTTYSNMSGATTSAAGKAGLVPAPAAGAATRYLRSDGTWQVPPNTTYTLSSFGVTATAAELNKLDGVTATAAELNYVDGVTSNIQTQLNGKAASSHNHSAANITSGTLAVARGGTGVTANPSMLVNLGSTTAAGVFAASPRPGVTGTLPIAKGGTGATTAAAALKNLGLTAVFGVDSTGPYIKEL